MFWFCATLVASFFAVTVAFGTTALLTSRTVPEMLDVPVCPSAAEAQITKRTKSEPIKFAGFNIGAILLSERRLVAIPKNHFKEFKVFC